MKFLFIGDPHAKINNLEDLSRVFDYAAEIFIKEECGGIVIFGDLYDTHAVLRQEIINFYRRYILNFSELTKNIFILAGNHDGYTPKSTDVNAVRLTLSDLANVVDKPVTLNNDSVLILPFMSDYDEFVKICNQHKDYKQVWCHQDFLGGFYETGMGLPYGVNPKDIPQEKVFSGHIHMKQEFGKVTYIGAPRAVSAGEANQSKYIYTYDVHSDTLKDFSTDHLVKCYKKIELNEEEDGNINIDVDNVDKDDIRVLVSGSEDFYSRVLDANENLVGKVKFIPNISVSMDKKVSVEDDSKESMFDALKKYVYEVEDMKEDDRDKVWQKIEKMM